MGILQGLGLTLPERVLAEAGHFPFLEPPAQFNRELEQFISNNTSGN
jgi:pimeloyl-ACP methyl ester carboxylesterase